MNARIVVSGGLACLLLAGFSGTASAGARVFDNSLSSCGSSNCSSLTIPGTVTNPSSNNDPFEIQFFAGTGECVRIEVISSLSGADLETVVRAPNGNIYRSDDGSGGGVFANPLVKIASAPNKGWYSVSINSWNGSPVYADFVLTYGRYTARNINCSGGTTPFAGQPPKDAPSSEPTPYTGGTQ